MFTGNKFYKLIVVLEHSRLNGWKDVTIVKVFLGILFHMGTIQMSYLLDYWRTDPLLKIGCIITVPSHKALLLK
jgi:hypothetical protein